MRTDGTRNPVAADSEVGVTRLIAEGPMTVLLLR
jgi:hypothetical protein